MSNLLDEIGIAHIGYFVSNLDAAVKRMTMLYGLSGFEFTDYKPTRAWVRGKEIFDYHVKIATSSPDTSIRMELLQPLSESPMMDMLKNSANTISHIGHSVKNYEMYRDILLDRGCELLIEAEMEDNRLGYRRSCYCFDYVMQTIFEISEIPHFR